MKCPVCEEAMVSMVCACGYDASRDHARYPTFAPVPKTAESVALLRDRRSELLLCDGCGYHGFRISRTTGEMRCIRCGQIPMGEEVGAAIDRLNWNKEELELLDAALKLKWEELSDMDLRLQRNRASLNKAQDQAAQMEQMLTDLDDEISRKRSELMRLTAEGEKIEVPEATQNADTGAALSESVTAPLKIKSIAANSDLTVAVYTNGTVRAIGKSDNGRCAVNDWKRVVSVAVCDQHTFGLTDQGTVLCTGKGEIPWTVARWKGIVAISANRTGVFGLKEDGRVVAANGGVGKKEIASWRDVKAISAGHGYVVGLKKGGTVVAAGRNDKGQCEVSSWKKIKFISAGTSCTIGLYEDGTAVNTGYKNRVFGTYSAVYQNIHQYDDEDDQSMIYGLYEDRSVAGIYYYTDVYQKMQNWGKMEMLTVVRGMVIGLKADGTVVSAGNDYTGVRNVSELNHGVE